MKIIDILESFSRNAFWYNPKSNTYVSVNRHHVATALANPEKFKLDKNELDHLYSSTNHSNEDKIYALLYEHGWIRGSITNSSLNLSGIQPPIDFAKTIRYITQKTDIDIKECTISFDSLTYDEENPLKELSWRRLKTVDDILRFIKNPTQKPSLSSRIFETKSTPLIVVDIQPAYSGVMDGVENPIFEEAIKFANNQSGKILLLMNGEEFSSDSIQNVKEYWEDSGFDPNNWNKVQIVDKGYGYLRSWMDNNVSRKTIIKVIRELYNHKVNDSRDLGIEYLIDLVGSEWEDWMESDPITVDWLSVKLLKQYNNCYIIGGAESECLAEVTLLMNAFNIKYKMINDLIY